MKILILTTISVSLESDKYTNAQKSSGGWIGMLVKNIQSSDDITQAAIVSVNASNENTETKVGKTICYDIKAKTITKKPQKELISKFQNILDSFKPDVIDIQGIEFSVGRDLLLCKVDCPVIATLQGLPMELSKIYYCGLPKNFKFCRTLYDNLHLKGTIEKERYMKMRGNISYSILKKADYIIGRTDWDRAHSWCVNPNARYFYNPRSFRDDFYKEENVWNIENIKRHRIFGIQGRDSAKGIHIGIEALNILKKDYPDVELIIPGSYRFNSPKYKIGAYEKYVKNLIKKYDLENNVKFVGSLSASEIIEYLKSSNAFCQYSLCENSPNSLGEAMMIGLPCVASFVGGTSTYMSNNFDGLMHQKSDFEMLAYNIKRVFDNDELAVSLSKNARESAIKRHSREATRNGIIEIYKTIYENKR